MQGLDRMQWAGLLSEGCEVEGWQLAPADLAKAHQEMVEDHANAAVSPSSPVFSATL